MIKTNALNTLQFATVSMIVWTELMSRFASGIVVDVQWDISLVRTYEHVRKIDVVQVTHVRIDRIGFGVQIRRAKRILTAQVKRSESLITRNIVIVNLAGLKSARYLTHPPM